MSDKDEFYRYIQQAASELRQQIEDLKSPGLDATARNIAIAECLSEINGLTGKIGGQAHKATSHDQRTYNETLKELKDQLQKVRSDIAPRRKFAFRPTAGQAAANSDSDASDDAPLTGASVPLTEENLQRVASASSNNNRVPLGKVLSPYIDLYNVLRTERDLDTADRGVFIANSSHSIIRCLMLSVTLTMTEVDRSLIVAGPIDGAAHITGLNNSIIAVSCRQLRLHHCRDTIVYIRGGSKPIIEHCSGMKFAPLPDDVAIAPLRGLGPGWWDQINDFNWLKGGQSPNWSVLKPEDRCTGETWKRVMNTRNDDEVEEVLQLFDITMDES
ncbi:MAG: hypothetical protein Q9218_001294 [Villophora microphyllina]